jgi:hypothetical protein
MDPRHSGIKGGEIHLEIRGYSLVFPIAVTRWIGPLSPADFLRLFFLRFLTSTLFGFRLGAFAGRFDARLDFGFREFWRSHPENRPLDPAPGQLTSP